MMRPGTLTLQPTLQCVIHAFCRMCYISGLKWHEWAMNGRQDYACEGNAQGAKHGPSKRFLAQSQTLTATLPYRASRTEDLQRICAPAIVEQGTAK